MRQGELVLNSAVSRQAKANKSSLVFWLNEIVLNSAISRQTKANKLSLVFWLNEIVLKSAISRQAKRIDSLWSFGLMKSLGYQ